LATIIFRYDGLYLVDKVFGSDGVATTISPSGNEQYTFFLIRLPGGNATYAQYSNKLSTDDLCRKINGDRSEKDIIAVASSIPQLHQLQELPDETIEKKKDPLTNSKAVCRPMKGGSQAPYHTSKLPYYQAQYPQHLHRPYQLPESLPHPAIHDSRRNHYPYHQHAMVPTSAVQNSPQLHCLIASISKLLGDINYNVNFVDGIERR
jgi:hypothetical protein